MNKISFIKKWLISNYNYILSRVVHSKSKFPRSSYVHPKVSINARLHLGECSSITAGSEFKGGDIHLGDRVIIGPNCLFMTDNHEFGRNARGFSPYGIGTSSKPVIVNNNVWIGSNVIFTPGTEIGKNSIVAAGSVLFGSYPDNTIIRGNPAVVIGKLDISFSERPITEVRTMRLNILHLFFKLKEYQSYDLYDIEDQEGWKRKYVYWASKINNG